MEIPRDLRPADPVARRRVPGAADRPAKPDAAPAPPADRAALAGGTEVQRFVQVLKTADPARLHRVEELRQRISEGSYSAEPEELADLILGEPRSDQSGGPRGR
jgi:anti-sigma28 factor (negative regulator of flagellin synthesis)